jgi:RNA polymerase sigma factor (TIGR02999 family)
MRQIMVDEARRRASLKRGGDRRRVDPELAAPFILPDDDLLALDEALETLEVEDERSHQVVMLRFFAGMTANEAAELLDVSERTVDRDWQFARAWLYGRLNGSTRRERRGGAERG